MKPLAQNDARAWANVQGVVFDIDDTVTRDGTLEEEAFAALWALKRAGFVLVPITGRPLGWVDVIARHWPVDVAVGENGGGWVWKIGGEVREGYFDTVLERERQAAMLERVIARVAREMPDVRLSGDHRARRTDCAFDIGEGVHLPEADVMRILSIIEAEGAHATRSSVHAHAIPGGWNKAVGAARAIFERFGTAIDGDLDRWVFVGDSPNDGEAFSYFQRTVGVANVREHLAGLPKPPVYVTEGDRGRGFAELAAFLVRARAHAPS